MRRKSCRKLDYAFIRNVHSGKSEDDALQDTSKSRCKGHAGVVGILGKHSERRPELVCIALLEDLERSLRIAQTGMQHCNDGIAHGRAVRVYPVKIVVDVTKGLLRICHYAKRICKHVHVGLLDKLSFITGIFHGDAVSIVCEHEIVGNRHPSRVHRVAKNHGSLCHIAQDALGSTVGECIVIDILCIFVRSDHVDDGVASVIILMHTAHPEISDSLEHRPCCLLEPFHVSCHAVILPHGNAHIGCDMMLICTGQCPYRSAFLA